MGRNMCSSCYQKWYRKAIIENDTQVEIPVSSEPEEDNFEEDFGNFEKRPGSVSDPVVNQVSSENNSAGSFSEKFKNFFGSKNAGEEIKSKGLKTSETKPKAYTKRVSGADSIGDAWSALGGLISRNPRHRPSGMLLQWQSAAAGEIIDEAIKGTVIDRMIVQKAVKARGRFDLIGSVLLPPAIVFAIEMNPDRAPMLIPVLENSLRNSLPHMVPAVKKARKREEEQAEAIRELFPDAPEGIDPVKELINELFGNWYPVNNPEDVQAEEESFNE